MELMLVIAGGILIAAAIVGLCAIGILLLGGDEDYGGMGCLLVLAALGAAAAVIYFALQLAPQLPRP